MRPIAASVVGQVSDTRWGQVLQTPHAYGVVEMHEPDGIARTRGIGLLTKLTRIFDTPPVSLVELTRIADQVMKEDVVSLILLVPVGSTLYLVSRGEGAVYLKRGTKLARLVYGEQSLSGAMKDGDTLIAASKGFIHTLTPEDIIGVFDHLTPQEVAEKLTIRLHEHDGGVGGVALIFQINDTDSSPSEESTASVLPPPAISRRTIYLSKMKGVARRVVPSRHRMRLRMVIHHLRQKGFLKPRSVMAFGIVVLFLLSVLLGIRRQLATATLSKTDEVLVEAQHSFDEGMALLDLNPVKGRERLLQARDLLSPIVSKKQRGQEAKKVKALYDEVIENLTRAMHVVEVTPELYFDMGLLKEGALATDVSLFESSLGILDANRKTVFTLGTSPKNGSIVGGGENFSESRLVAMYGDKLYVWTPKGIHQVRLTDQKTVPNVIPAAPDWGNIADMTVFGGNIYLLDIGKNRIWKYVAAEKGFSQLFEYLNPDTLPDLSKTTNMAIDGSVWLGTTTGNIMRFTSGKENSFTTQGEEIPLGQNLKVYTHDEAKMVYILDTDHQRVVVYDKDGLYMSQYVWDSGFIPSALVVSEETGKIFLLRDGKIYSIDLK